MDNYTATELAYNNGYKNGYEQGKKDAVKHGRWHGYYQIDEFHYIHICSECGNRNVFHKYDSLCNYCPNCGAKMDGGEA